MLVATFAALTLFSACDDGKSYADLLTDERKAANYYLSGCRVVDAIPDDNKFETGTMRRTIAWMTMVMYICRSSIPAARITW